MTHRQQDIQHVGGRLHALGVRRDEVLRDFDAYRTRVQEELRGIDEEVEGLRGVQKYLLRLEVESRPPEYVDGINVSRLDPETRLLVESGNLETITVLRAATR